VRAERRLANQAAADNRSRASSTTRAGSSPSTGLLQNALNTIPALNGNVSVANGPAANTFDITFNNVLTGQNGNQLVRLAVQDV
jgi:hypothetical protein